MSEKDVKWEFEREKCVLMVIDMQNDYVLDGAIMQVKEAKKQIPKIQKLIAKCRELNIPIIYTVHKTDIKGADGIKIVDDLMPSANDIVLYKPRFSAFYQTDLEVILRNINPPSSLVDTIIICGTVTDICCEATARDAFSRDYKVVFGSDICSADDKSIHEATLKNMEIFGCPMDCETIIKSLENGKNNNK